VIFYADRITDSMRRAIDETQRRRKVQEEYNRRHGITPASIVKPVDAALVAMSQADYYEVSLVAEEGVRYESVEELDREIERLRGLMKEAAERLEFEKAAEYRDRLRQLQEVELTVGGADHVGQAN